jgi:hypothetical protein
MPALRRVPQYISGKTNQKMADMNPNGGTTARPTLLTVICIISFIMGAWGIYGGVKQLTQDPDKVVAQAQADMEKARAQMPESNPLTDKMMESAMEVTRKGAEQGKPIGATSIVLSLLSILGVWQMWNLKKSGFWLYVLASVLGLVAPVYFLGGGLIALASVGVVGLFTILFIILYAVNLKYMH